MATAFAVTMIAAGPLLAPSAYAEDGSPAIQTVDFAGGSVLSMLLCRSEPSTGRLTIPAESRVMFVNRLGQNAVLRVNGKVVAQVGPDQAVPVVFHHGPVRVAMTFPCGTGVVEQFTATAVAVTAAARPEALQSAAPVPPPAVSPAAQPVRSPSPKARLGRSGQPGAGALAAVAAESSVASPSSAPVASAIAGPASATLSAAKSSPGAKAADAVAVEPLVRMSGTPRDTSSGVLALLAAAFAVCVTVAAIRAIMTKPIKSSAMRVR